MLAETAAACILFAAKANHLPPAIVVSILAVEGGHEGSRSPDSDGSADLGPGQINTFWLPAISQVTRRSEAEIARQLQFDGCFNIRATAAVLRYEIDRAKGDFWTGVARYHSPQPVEGSLYVAKIVAMAERLYGPNALRAR